jgi:xanthine dehydrogenase YagS FAD-binding subunit
MKQFEYVKAGSTKSVISALAQPGTKIIAGGTNLVDLMKRGVTSPDKLIDITGLPLKDILTEQGGLYIGTLALNSTVSENDLVLKKQPLLSMALKAGASPQLRNMATVGGNMMQRTRCGYFYDIALPCNKRQPGTGCSAKEGYNRMHAIFGTSDKCIAVHPSDMCVALAALEATVIITGKNGKRTLPFTDFHKLPGETPELDNHLAKDEIILGVQIPDNNFADHSYYLKIRDRQSYAFALVSVAVALDISNGVIKNARIAMGGVAHKPWRLYDAEKALAGKQPSVSVFEQIAKAAIQDAKAFKHNEFKITLAPNAIVQALKIASGLATA